MPDNGIFFSYSPNNGRHKQEDLTVLLHANRPRWLAVNRTALETARQLADGRSVDEIARQLRQRYGVPFETARRDVCQVRDELQKQGIIEPSPTESLFRQPHLNMAYIHVTARCNLTCPQCYISRQGGSTPADLPLSLIVRMIDAVSSAGGNMVTLSGGEPLLHPEFKSILTHAAAKLNVRLLTNGMLIDGHWAELMAPMDIHIQISLDGSNREIHDAVRGTGTFDSVLKAVDTLQAVGLGERLIFSTTVMEQNIKDLPEIIELAARLEVPQVRFLPVKRMGRADSKWDEIGGGLRIADYETFYRYAAELRLRKRPAVDISCGLSGFFMKIPREITEDEIWCPVGRQLVVTVDGEVFPCPLLMRPEFKLGNVFHDPLEQLIESEKMAAVCRNIHERRTRIERCGACSFRNLCQGGCMGEALDHTGTIWDVDNFCHYRQAAYRDAFEKILSSSGCG
jgi:radical SAM protein with 4Fe4S-binding SPASM domain